MGVKWVYYVDLENVQPVITNPDCEVIYVTTDFCPKKGNINIRSSGKNALDYALVSVLASRLSYNEIYVIVSKDKGYDIVIDYLAAQGYLLCRHDGVSCTYMPERIEEFLKVMTVDVSDFTQKLSALYKRRTKHKLDNSDVKEVFGSKIKSLPSAIIHIVCRAYNLGYSHESFEQFCEGMIPTKDSALRASLIKVLQNEGIELRGCLK